jgi:hypothetical protein
MHVVASKLLMHLFISNPQWHASDCFCASSLSDLNGPLAAAAPDSFVEEFAKELEEAAASVDAAAPEQSTGDFEDEDEECEGENEEGEEEVQSNPEEDCSSHRKPFSA